MHLRSSIILIIFLLASISVMGQLDRSREGFSIEPANLDYNAEINLSLKLSPIQGFTNKNVKYRINYTQMEDSFKKKSGVNITQTRTVEKPSWDIKEQFLEIKGNLVDFEKDFDLGRASTNSKIVVIQCRDFGEIDGDMIRIELNEAVIIPKKVLGGGFYSVDVELKEGVNYITFTALNEGYIRPNTAYFRVMDENGFVVHSKEWYMTTGYKAVFKLVKN